MMRVRPRVVSKKLWKLQKRLKEAGLDIETISLCTGLPVALVEGM